MVDECSSTISFFNTMPKCAMCDIKQAKQDHPYCYICFFLFNANKDINESRNCTSCLKKLAKQNTNWCQECINNNTLRNQKNDTFNLPNYIVSKKNSYKNKYNLIERY